MLGKFNSFISGLFLLVVVISGTWGIMLLAAPPPLPGLPRWILKNYKKHQTMLPLDDGASSSTLAMVLILYTHVTGPFTTCLEFIWSRTEWYQHGIIVIEKINLFGQKHLKTGENPCHRHQSWKIRKWFFCYQCFTPFIYD